MWTSRLFWKLLAVNLSVLVAFGAASWHLLADRAESQARSQRDRRLLDTCRTVRHVVRGLLLADDQEGLKRQVGELARETGLRMTVIGADGRVLADSSQSPDRMDNHFERPEVRESSGPARYGMAQRTSTSTGKAMYYCAMPIAEGEWTQGYVRVAIETPLLDGELRTIRLELAACLVAALAAGATATFYFSRRLVQTMEATGRHVAELAEGADRAPLEGRAFAPVDDAGADEPPDPLREIEQLDAGVGRLKGRVAQRISQLREDADRLANVLSNMAEGVLALDADQRIVLANEASRRLLEFSADRIEGRPLWEVMRNRSLEETVAEALHSGAPCVREFESLGASRRILALRATRLPGDPPPGVLLVLHDVTDLRRLENLRREFVANVSHELKTPLASIKAYAETLRLGAIDDPENNLQFVVQIEEQAERLHELILDLLQLARVESGQEVFDITSVLVDPVVASCFKAHATKAAAKRIALRTEPAPRPTWLKADEEGLRTILSNLIDNAIKYTPEGGTVTVRWNVDGHEAWCEVQDTGIGISRQHHARIFERFYRVDKARSREIGGTGLGLSIVKHLTQAFGGAVRVESQPRFGSTFRVTLPLAEPGED